MAVLISNRRTPPQVAELRHERVTSLRDWLAGSWALVLSHPEDFAPHPSTPAGFIGCLADAILAQRIKPIGFVTAWNEPSASWLDHAFNDDAVVVLNRSTSTVADCIEWKLAAQIASVRSRFVVVLDERGHCRRTLPYWPTPDRPRTMLELMDIVTALRSDGSTNAGVRRRRPLADYAYR